MSYRITLRRGPRVHKEQVESLDEALTSLEAFARTTPRRDGVEFVSRSYEPGDIIAARIELRGDGLAAGLDVRGDGSMVAWTGRLRRRAIEPQDGENPVAALRRVLRA